MKASCQFVMFCLKCDQEIVVVMSLVESKVIASRDVAADRALHTSLAPGLADYPLC